MIKEHIAAALVLMTSRGYSDPLIDPCCGSGTIPIEAAMIASNRAPGLLRSFACEEFPDPQRAKAVQDVVDTAKTKIFEKDYIILGYDIQQELIDQAKTNAESA
jgi:putative N6-adenine-specific DNA methylase